ncbi:hypothetical protein R3W88_012851 [Solanum pinnatisectum]|uniref:S-locus glycoprotein domain-containing protein n=1 Tax=Solanum pinnatisectum TaxID=50273 RepID=A0AAV9LAU5_9SOLN|nr:hypothetical protein R3W88_012851 [Solanum pinnatisectum]
MKASFFLLFQLTFYSSVHKISTTADIITTNHSVTYGETIVSSGGTFEMGFFSPSGYSKRYTGICTARIFKLARRLTFQHRRTTVIQLQGNALYTLILLESGYPQALVKRGTTVLGRSGPWNGLHWSGDHAPSSSQSSIYKIQFVFNKEEVFYSFYFISSLVLSRLILTKQWLYAKPHVRESDQELALPQFTTLPPNTTYSLCGAYGSCDIDHSPVKSMSS